MVIRSGILVLLAFCFNFGRSLLSCDKADPGAQRGIAVFSVKMELGRDGGWNKTVTRVILQQEGFGQNLRGVGLAQLVADWRIRGLVDRNNGKGGNIASFIWRPSTTRYDF